MQFNAQPAVSDPRFAPDTNGTTMPPIDDGRSALSANHQHVDINKQCGVPLDNGVPCSESLLCSAHTLTQKRTVPGRSIDQLLGQSQPQQMPLQ